MMNFRKSVTKSGKRTFYFHGLSWQQRKQYKSNVDENFFQRPSDAYVSIVQISFQLKLPFRSLVGVFTQHPLGQGVGQEHLGRARVKNLLTR